MAAASFDELGANALTLSGLDRNRAKKRRASAGSMYAAACLMQVRVIVDQLRVGTIGRKEPRHAAVSG
jgi:hypothetical protein